MHHTFLFTKDHIISCFPKNGQMKYCNCDFLHSADEETKAEKTKTHLPNHLTNKCHFSKMDSHDEEITHIKGNYSF